MCARKKCVSNGVLLERQNKAIIIIADGFKVLAKRLAIVDWEDARDVYDGMWDSFDLDGSGTPSRRREFCKFAAPRSPFSRRFNRDDEGVPAK